MDMDKLLTLVLAFAFLVTAVGYVLEVDLHQKALAREKRWQGLLNQCLDWHSERLEQGDAPLFLPNDTSETPSKKEI